MHPVEDNAPDGPIQVPDATTTSDLVSRARDGDETAYARLVSSFAPLLRRWAHGRMSKSARGPIETEDLVQDTLLSVHRRLGSIEARRPGAFWLYLRRALQHQISNSARSASRRPSADVAVDGVEGGDIPANTGENDLLDYERGLEKLDEDQRAIVVLRLEFGFSHAEVADALGLPSADAARMRATRAVAQLAEYMS